MKNEQHCFSSSFREKVIEHLFVGELLKISWQRGHSLEISHPEVDNQGYDLILELNRTIRHLQLKASYSKGKTVRQKISLSLGKKSSGCVVWIYFDADSLALGPFMYFGGNAGCPLPDISHFKTAKHEKGDSSGYKADRPNIKVVNKGMFERHDSIVKLYDRLFYANNSRSQP